MPQILPHDEITEDIKSLNSKQRKVFNVVHKWAKKYENVMDIIYNAVSKLLLYHCKDPHIKTNRGLTD